MRDRHMFFGFSFLEEEASTIIQLSRPRGRVGQVL